MSKECPGDGWRKGIVRDTKKGTKWWNNGSKTTTSKVCPGDGWVVGRL